MRKCVVLPIVAILAVPRQERLLPLMRNPPEVRRAQKALSSSNTFR